MADANYARIAVLENEIEYHLARIAVLEAALKPFADIAKQTEHWSGPPVSVPLYIIRAAAAALKETGDE